MGCCGQNRAALSNLPPANHPSTLGQAAWPSPSAGLSSPWSQGRPVADQTGHRSVGPTAAPGSRVIRLRYIERKPVMVRGPASGAEYRFSLDDAVQSVDLRDADALLRSSLFVRA